MPEKRAHNTSNDKNADIQLAGFSKTRWERDRSKKGPPQHGTAQDDIALSGFASTRWALARERKNRENHLKQREETHTPLKKERGVLLRDYQGTSFFMDRIHNKNGATSAEAPLLVRKAAQKTEALSFSSNALLARVNASMEKMHGARKKNAQKKTKPRNLRHTWGFPEGLRKKSLSKSDPVIQKQFMHMFVFAFVVQLFGAFTPIAWVNTFFHEISHAVVLLVTGGDVLFVKFNMDSTAFVRYASGWEFFAAWAGYAGEIFWGSLIYRLGLNGSKNMRTFSIFVFLALLVACNVVFVRDSKSMTVVTALYLMVMMIPLCHFLQIGANTIRHCFRFMGMYMVFGGFIEPIFLSFLRGQYYDALFLAHITGLPAGFWMFTWVMLALFAIRRLWRLTLTEKWHEEQKRLSQRGFAFQTT